MRIPVPHSGHESGSTPRNLRGDGAPHSKLDSSPRASSLPPSRRGGAVAPLIPGLNDGQVAEILRRARDSGATSAFRTMLRLPGVVKGIFLSRLEEAMPDRAAKVERAIREARGGALDDPRFGARFRGRGSRREAVSELFDIACCRLGLASEEPPPRESPLRRPGTLF